MTENIPIRFSALRQVFASKLDESVKTLPVPTGGGKGSSFYTEQSMILIPNQLLIYMYCTYMCKGGHHEVNYHYWLSAL